MNFEDIPWLLQRLERVEGALQAADLMRDVLREQECRIGPDCGICDASSLYDKRRKALEHDPNK